jgi:hypothetical protein
MLYQVWLFIYNKKMIIDYCLLIIVWDFRYSSYPRTKRSYSADLPLGIFDHAASINSLQEAFCEHCLFCLKNVDTAKKRVFQSGESMLHLLQLDSTYCFKFS